MDKAMIFQDSNVVGLGSEPVLGTGKPEGALQEDFRPLCEEDVGCPIDVYPPIGDEQRGAQVDLHGCPLGGNPLGTLGPGKDLCYPINKLPDHLRPPRIVFTCLPTGFLLRRQFFSICPSPKKNPGDGGNNPAIEQIAIELGLCACDQSFLPDKEWHHVAQEHHHRAQEKWLSHKNVVQALEREEERPTTGQVVVLAEHHARAKKPDARAFQLQVVKLDGCKMTRLPTRYLG